MTLAAFFAIWLLHLMAAVSPGPVVLMSARVGIQDGFRTGVFLSIGIGLGGVLWAVAALFGLNLLFSAAPSVLTAFKIAGGLYLIWLGWHIWRDARTKLDIDVINSMPTRSPMAALRLGVLTQIANPKPAVLFSAIFLGTVPETASVATYGAILAVVFLNEAIWNTFVARLFSFERTRLGYLSLKTLIDRAFGGMLALLGAKVAAT